MYCVLNFGVSIPKVAKQIQENIHQAILNMTGLETDEINVHIVNVQFESPKEEEDHEE